MFPRSQSPHQITGSLSNGFNAHVAHNVDGLGAQGAGPFRFRLFAVQECHRHVKPDQGAEYLTAEYLTRVLLVS